MVLLVTKKVKLWTLEEYKKAVSNLCFQSFVQTNLCSGDDTEEQLLNKYFLAGGSARWMFGFPPEEAIKDIKVQLEKADNLTDLASGIKGKRGVMAVNHLVMVDPEGQSFLVSEYVSRQIAERCETSFIRLAANVPLTKC